MKIHVKLLALTLLLPAGFLMVSHRVAAQSVDASIHGTVTDSTGAVVPGATVTALNTSTGISTTIKTDSKGYYVFQQLHIGGPYTVSIDRSGFESFKSTGLMLNLNAARQIDAILKTGSVSQTVQVTSGTVQVQTSDSQLKTTILGQEIVDLPILGRDPVQLQKTTPGVVESSDRFGTFSTNGSQTPENSFMLDGGDITFGGLNTAGLTPNPDALAEFNVVTSTLNPEFSRNSGAIINEALKSGTNQFHGDAFEFYRDTFLNNGNYFSYIRPVFHQNLFGGTLGGPIIKNHTFFFFAYQGIRNVAGATILTPVLSSRQLAGDFSGDTNLLTHGTNGTKGLSSHPIPFAMGSCAAGTPWNKCFPTGQISPQDFNTISAAMVKKYVPAANDILGGNAYYNYNTANTLSDNQEIARIDEQLTQNDSLFGSVIFESAPTTQTLPFTGSTLPGFAQVNTAHTKFFDGDYTHIFNQTTLNELRASYFRFNDNGVVPETPVAPSSAGFNIVSSNTAAESLPFIGITGYFSLGFSHNGPQPRIGGNYDFMDNFSKVAGGHNLRFGANVQHFTVSNPFYAANNGSYNFGGGGTYTSGDPMVDFLTGVPQNYNQGSPGDIIASAWEYYFYAQDNWKVSDSLTVNYGLGYDTETPYAMLQFGRIGVTCWSASTAQSNVFAGGPPGMLWPGDPGCNTYGGPTTKLANIAPRVGFAWSPVGGLGVLTGAQGAHLFSVRGGFGVYYNRNQEEGSLQNLGDPPFVFRSHGAADLGGSPGFADPFQDVAGRAALSETNPFPFVVPHAGQAINFRHYEPLDINNTDPNYAVPYTYNYNLNVQRELPSDMVLTVSYVGSLGRKLVRAYEGDQITSAGHAACLANPACVSSRAAAHLLFPQYMAQPATIPGTKVPYYLSVGTQHTDGASSYNSLQVSLAKQTTHGLYFTVSYTYSHAMDNASGLENSGFGTLGTNWVPGFQYLTYGDSSYDARHRLVTLYNYEVPLPHFLKENPYARYALGGWHATGVTALQTGFPVTISETSVFNSLYCDQFSYYACPDTPNTSTFHIPSLNPRAPGHYWFNPSVFSAEPIGTFGNVKRNFFHGPGFNYSNIEIYKNLPLGAANGPRFIQLRLEAYNAFNHPNFAGPNGNFSAGPHFGQITSVIQQGSGDPQPGRAIQIAAKFYF
ncbi:MAG: carboxypeptidase-like regulatory domain-containing protein [Acidobacteriaceae bacterium]